MKMHYAIIFVLALSFFTAILLVHGTSGQAIKDIGSTSIYIFGVSTEANGTIFGVPSLLSLTVTNGTGQVFLGSTPLVGTNTQAQAEVSAQVACQLINVNCNDYNFYYYISSGSAEVSGPSAGAAFAVAAMAVLTNRSIKPGVAMTGTANPDGSIGLVGDVGPKSEAAANQGIKVFLYPAYEPSVDNITAQALAYDQSLGMVAIPITTVYQAYQYFTGYNITPVPNYNIYDGLFNSLMNSTYQEFNAYQETIYNSLPNKTSTNATINGYIQTALSSIQGEAKLAAQGNYYVAASDVVNTSATLLLYSKVLEEFSASSNPEQLMANLISSENTSIQQTYGKITQDYLTNTSTLDLKFIAIDRLAQAQSFLNEAQSSLTNNLQNAAHLYALAEIKRVSSIFWLSILPQGNSNFSEASYANLSNYYLYEASSYYDYASLLGNPGSPELSLVQNYLSSAQTYQEQGHYVASIFRSLKSIALSNLVIEENSISVNGSTAVVTNQVSLSALDAIDTAEAAGITPFLGISYYQFGNSFRNSSIAFYIEFEALSRVYTGFESALANLSAVPFNSVFQPAAVPSISIIDYQTLAYVVLGIAIGVLLSGVLYEYRLWRMKKAILGTRARRQRKRASKSKK